MPLVVVTGPACSGKSRRARELRGHFARAGRDVRLVSEERAAARLGYGKNEVYSDSQKEKRLRAYLKSEVIRLIGKDCLVILDGSNYIKGFRYELYCVSKAAKTTQCTVYTIRNNKEAQLANQKRRLAQEESKRSKPEEADTRKERREDKSECEDEELEENEESEAYTEEIFDALTNLRFEEPNSNNRWDSPLITVQFGEPLDMNTVHSVLYEKKPPPPNMSTQNPPLSSTNYLYELDRVTQDISKQILDSKQLSSGAVRFPDYPDCPLEIGFLDLVTPQQLLRLRRQFLTYAKMQYKNEDCARIGRYYIQYLNKSLEE